MGLLAPSIFYGVQEYLRGFSILKGFIAFFPAFFIILPSIMSIFLLTLFTIFILMNHKKKFTLEIQEKTKQTPQTRGKNTMKTCNTLPRTNIQACFYWIAAVKSFHFHLYCFFSEGMKCLSMASNYWFLVIWIICTCNKIDPCCRIEGPIKQILDWLNRNFIIHEIDTIAHKFVYYVFT